MCPCTAKCSGVPMLHMGAHTAYVASTVLNVLNEGLGLQGFGVLTHDKAVCDAAQL